jgi:hypothetical protein
VKRSLHLLVALGWSLLAIPAWLWWRESVGFVIAASVFANVYAAISAMEAADDRALLRRMDLVLTELRRLRDELP